MSPEYESPELPWELRWAQIELDWQTIVWEYGQFGEIDCWGAGK